MALATFKDLCLDARDPVLLGEFWAGALDLELHRQEGGDTYLTGPTPQHTIWVNRVAEPQTVKHRVHLDVNVGSVAELEARGAAVLDAESFRWVLMADPEGGEFCAFVREGPIAQRLFEVVVDTADSPEEAHRLAAWWAEVLGGRLVDSERGFSYVDQVPGTPYDSLDFIPVPEPKTAKNRVHLDVSTPDLDALLAAGATVLHDRADLGWTVLADPAGNEFCAFPA
jgi:Glyoxalase-like domain